MSHALCFEKNNNGDETIVYNSRLKESVASELKEFDLNARKSASKAGNARSGDVAKLFSKESRYSNGTKETICRRYQIF